MNSPTRLVWSLAGRPNPIPTIDKLATDTPDSCCVCGEHATRTADANKALGANFTDRSMYRDHRSSRVCIGCLWCCSGKPPATLRMWSVVAAPNVNLPPSHEKCAVPTGPGLHFTNRAAPQAVTAILLNPPPGPWMVTVATSGQKHVVPYGTVNHGTHQWTVRLESTNVTSNPSEFSTVLTAAARLRAAKHRADDITDGAPTLAAIKTEDDLREWNTHQQTLLPYRGSPLLDLALWTLTKETINDHT